MLDLLMTVAAIVTLISGVVTMAIGYVDSDQGLRIEGVMFMMMAWLILIAMGVY